MKNYGHVPKTGKNYKISFFFLVTDFVKFERKSKQTMYSENLFEMNFL